MENVTPHPWERGACWPLGCPVGASPGFELHQCVQSSGVPFQTTHFYTVFRIFFWHPCRFKLLGCSLTPAWVTDGDLPGSVSLGWIGSV